MILSVAEIITATGGRLIGSPEGETSGVSTDSRTINSNDLYLPLSGAHFDGHQFFADVMAKGVRTAIASEQWLAENSAPALTTVIAVPDTLRALGDLAAAYRRRFTLPVTGITGSNGKTTTKEMLACILGQNGSGLKTAGNLNNLIGLPQMIFKLDATHRWAVLEMGMSEFGEIDRLAEIAAPQIGVITNAYPAHLASMGSVAGVARAKGELFLRLPQGGTAIYNADDPLVSACPVPPGVKRTGFGLHHTDVTATDIQSLGLQGQSFQLQIGTERVAVVLRAFGQHSIYNALAAAAAAHAMGLSLPVIAGGLAGFTPYDKRFTLEDLRVILLIDDSYNANPASVGAALLTVLELKGSSRGIAVLGDMLELGEDSAEAHRDVGRLAATCVDKLYLYGEMATIAADGAIDAGLAATEVIVAATHDEIVADIVKDHSDGDMIIVKGSRGMRMDIVATALRDIFSDSAYHPGGRV